MSTTSSGGVGQHFFDANETTNNADLDTTVGRIGIMGNKHVFVLGNKPFPGQLASSVALYSASVTLNIQAHAANAVSSRSGTNTK